MTCSPMASSSAASCGQPRRREGDAGGRLLAPPAPGECRYRGLARRRVETGSADDAKEVDSHGSVCPFWDEATQRSMELVGKECGRQNGCSYILAGPI